MKYDCGDMLFKYVSILLEENVIRQGSVIFDKPTLTPHQLNKNLQI